jgi:D-alanyl-lipoteichoic acid acyltransferase DltB (MBOAT superfamily)
MGVGCVAMPLNSLPFLLLAVCAVFVVPVARGWLRTTIFLAINLTFVVSYWGLGGLPVGLTFCLAGFLCARLVRGRSTAALVVSVVILTAMFIYLRGYAGGGASAPTRLSAAGIFAIAGLSFLFFKMLHVVVDASSGTIERLTLGRYLNYCLNFTTVLMGPIQRYQDFAAQWDGETPDAPRFENYVDAANRTLRGFVKAFIFAPTLAPYILRPGMPIEQMGGLELLAAIYAFYIFLYFDFSGYCDIVIGIGILMGLRPPENFRFPFLARDVSSYWLRVHRSLTTWLTDYVFTPFYRYALGSTAMGRFQFLALSASLLLTMIIAGVWHGTAWHFAMFGLVHGVALVVVRVYEHVMTRRMGKAGFRRFTERPAVTAAAVFLTYNFTSLAYLFFVLDVHESVRVMERLAVTAGLAP